MLMRSSASAKAAETMPAISKTLPRRFFVRGSLLWRWLRRIVLPGYWKSLIGAMALMTLGSLAEAASFLVAAHLLIHWAAIEQDLSLLSGNPLVYGGGALVLLLGIGAFCGYAGYRIAVRTVLDFETSCFAYATNMLRQQERNEAKLGRAEQKVLLFDAPRFMGRVLLQFVGLGSSTLLVIAGAIICSMTFPRLALILGFILLFFSPLILYNTLRSTNIGHKIREASARYNQAKKDIHAKWVSQSNFDIDSVRREAENSADYYQYHEAFGKRLLISPFSNLVMNLVLSVCVLATIMWSVATLDLNMASATKIITFLIALRMFFAGTRAIMTSIQIIASFVPYFLEYLARDQRMK